MSITTAVPMKPQAVATSIGTPPAAGRLQPYNASAGALAPVLPVLTNVADLAQVAVEKDGNDTSSNKVTVTCSGSDTFAGGATTIDLLLPGERVELQAATIGGVRVWKVMRHSTPRSSLDQRFGTRLPSVGERLRRAAAGAIGRNGVELGVSAKPPVITTGTATLDATLTNAYRYTTAPNQGKFRFTGGIVQAYATAYSCAYAVTVPSGGNFPGDATKQANEWANEFVTDAPRVQLRLFGTNPFQVEVDDQPITGAGITPASGNPNYTLLDFSVGSATIVAATGVFTTKDASGNAVAHGLAVGDQVELGAITGTTGVSASTPYWIITTPTSSTFTLSSTPAGTALSLTTDGSTTAVSQAKTRRFRGEFSQASAFDAVMVGARYTIWAPKSATNVRVVIVGDSIPAATGTLMPNGCWTKIAGKLLGWTDVREGALGGTALINPGTAFGANNPFNKASRIADTVAHAPDLLVINLSQNDDTYTASAIQAAALATFQAYRAALPTVPIVVFGADASSSGPSAARIATDTAGHAGFTQWADPNSWFIENVNDPTGSWSTGTGTAAAKTGTGNRDRDGSDPAHPNTGGHKNIGQRFAQAFRDTVLPYIA